MSVRLKRFTSFDYGAGIGYLEVFVNPAHVAYAQPRRRSDPHNDGQQILDGTLLYFQQEAGVVAVKEDIGLVVATLTSRGGVCRDCHQELAETWMSLCAHCREHRHDGIDHDPAQTGDQPFAPLTYALEHEEVVG
jgi:hypothetical protein